MIHTFGPVGRHQTTPVIVNQSPLEIHVATASSVKDSTSRSHLKSPTHVGSIILKAE
jgi:hypothetical protein